MQIIEQFTTVKQEIQAELQEYLKASKMYDRRPVLIKKDYVGFSLWEYRKDRAEDLTVNPFKFDSMDVLFKEFNSKVYSFDALIGVMGLAPKAVVLDEELDWDVQ